MTVKDIAPDTRFKASGQWYTLRRIGPHSAVVTIGDDPRRVTVSLGTVVDKIERQDDARSS